MTFFTFQVKPNDVKTNNNNNNNKGTGENVSTATCSEGKTLPFYKSTCIQLMYAKFNRIM